MTASMSGGARVVRIDREAALREAPPASPSGSGSAAGSSVAHVVEEDRERPRGRDGGVLLPERAGGGVARVGESGLACLLELRVQPREGRARHVHLAAHLEPSRRLEQAVQRGGDGLDRAQVLGDVLAHPPVAARRAARESPALVEERDAEPVDLRLADVLKAGARRGAARYAPRTPGGRPGPSALSSDSMAVRCSTGAKASARRPPGPWVGLSGVISSGCACSSIASSRYRRSYSASETSGRSRT